MNIQICDVVGCEKPSVSNTSGSVCIPHKQQRYNDLKKGLGWPRDGDKLEVGTQAHTPAPAPAPAPVKEDTPAPVKEETLPPLRPTPSPAPAPAPAPATKGDVITGDIIISEDQRNTLAEILGGGKDPRVDEILERLGRVETSISASYRVEVVTDTSTKEIRGLNHRIFPWVLTLLGQGYNVYLCGPSGSGKTTLAMKAAEALERPFFYTGAILQKYELLGYMDATGNYISTSFYQAYKDGGLYLWDEIDASNPGALVAFNAALENGILSAPNGEVVPMHKDFQCIAAANTIGKGATLKHAGRQPIDGAVTERYAFAFMNYDWALTAALTGVEYEGEEKPIEIHVKRSYSQADVDGYFGDVIAYSKAVEELGVNHIVSPRAALKGVELLRQDIKRDLVEEAFIWKGLDAATIKKIKGKAKEIDSESGGELPAPFPSDEIRAGGN